MMASFCKQGRIRTELAVGLLIIVLGTLEGSEGLKCYTKKDVARDCSAGENACFRLMKREASAQFKCVHVTNEFKQCMDEEFGKEHCMLSLYHDATHAKQDRCNEILYPETIPGRNYTGSSSPKPKDLEDRDRTSGKGRLDVPKIFDCWCYTDLCNPSGRSTPESQVIFGVVVAASFYTFNVGLVSL